MKILAIVGSTRSEEKSGVNTLVRRVAEGTGMECEIVSLRGKKIHGCIACMGCVHDNVCVVDDDMKGLREKIVEADAYIIGAPNFYTGMNAISHAFMERWYQFRHRTADTLWGKLAVAVGVGGGTGEPVVNEIEKFMLYNFIETVEKVHGQGAASCFTCGYGESCGVGVPRMMFGEDVKITEEIIPGVHKQPELLERATQAGRNLAKRLTEGHDRKAVAMKVQEVMMAKFKEST